MVCPSRKRPYASAALATSPLVAAAMLATCGKTVLASWPNFVKATVAASSSSSVNGVLEARFSADATASPAAFDEPMSVVSDIRYFSMICPLARAAAPPAEKAATAATPTALSAVPIGFMTASRSFVDFWKFFSSDWTLLISVVNSALLAPMETMSLASVATVHHLCTTKSLC